jgi:hypothetical protein
VKLEIDRESIVRQRKKAEIAWHEVKAGFGKNPPSNA